MWGKDKKANISYDTLCLPQEQGGIGLLDIRARNKAITLTWVKQYADLSAQRPTWAPVMDVLVGQLITKSSGKVHDLSKFHIFMQTWKTDVRPSAGLPMTVRGMLSVAKEMRVTFAAVKPTRKLRQQMPIWYHLGANRDLNKLNNHYYSHCLRAVHGVTTTADAMAMTRRLRMRTTPPHRRTPDCTCDPCSADRANGCNKPHACCALAEKMLQTLPDIWNPLDKTPHDGLSLSREDRRVNIERRNLEEPFLFDPTMTSADELTSGFRVFYDVDAPPRYPPRWLPGPRAIVRADTTHAHIASAATKEDSRDARAGAAVAFRCTGIMSGRVPIILPQSQLTAEATGVIMATLNTPTDAPLHIHTTSTQITEALNAKLSGWEDRDWTGVRDKMILRSAAYHLRRRSAPTMWHLHKKAGAGSEEARLAGIEAELSIHEDAEMALDLSIPPQYNNSGVKLSELTQRLAYQKIRTMKANPPKQRATNNLHATLLAVDKANGMRPTDRRIWGAIRTKSITRQIADFLWKAMHGSMKCGSFWRNVPGMENRGICSRCDRTESLEHLLLDCAAIGQEDAWGMAKEAWERTGHGWPQITLGTILGVGLIAPPNTNGGEQRLLKILISETAWLVWKLRCERVIGHEDDQGWEHTQNEVRNRWLHSINSRLTIDRVTTTEARFGRRATPKVLIKATWKKITNMADAPDAMWYKSHGVLVGRGCNDPG